MFRVQRAGVASKAAWQTICTNSSAAYARGIYQRQLKINSVGRFRLLDPADKVLAEAKAQPLFQREESDDEQRAPTYYTPPAVTPRSG